MYETLTEFEDKITPEDAYQQIKELYKELKTLRKKEKSEWDGDYYPN